MEIKGKNVRLYLIPTNLPVYTFACSSFLDIQLPCGMPRLSH